MKYHGFSIVEMLIVLLLSSLTISAMITVFLVHRRHIIIINHMIDLQEQSRFAAHVLVNTITTAGYIGCANLLDGMVVDHQGVDAIEAINTYNALQIFKASSHYLPAFITAKPKKGSDVIIVRSANPMSSLLQVANHHSQLLTVFTYKRFKKGDDILLSDCLHAQLFRVNDVLADSKGREQLLLNRPSENDYFTTAQVSTWQTIAFYIAITHRLGKTISALYQQQYGHRRHELIANVNAMQVRRKGCLLSISLMLQHKPVSIAIALRECAP